MKRVLASIEERAGYLVVSIYEQTGEIVQRVDCFAQDLPDDSGDVTSPRPTDVVRSRRSRDS